MNGGLTTDATLGRTARAALEHLRRHSGYATWLLTRTNDYEQIVIASVDPQFSIVAKETSAMQNIGFAGWAATPYSDH